MAKSIKLDSELWRRIEQHAAEAGYSSPEEFVQHALERELSRQEPAKTTEDIERSLKGLGYLE